MKKMWKVAGIVVVLIAALALFGAVAAYAQGPNPTPGAGRMGPCQGGGLLDIDEEEMHAALADALGISVEEFEAARADGTPLYVIAQELGVDMDAVRAAMRDVREAAIDEALAAGTISEAQADWLRSRPGPGGYGYGYGYGPGNGMGYGRQFGGRGFGGGNGYGPGAGMFSQG
jgi:Spy/CpxP family protein refolding chaperone